MRSKIVDMFGVKAISNNCFMVAYICSGYLCMIVSTLMEGFYLFELLVWDSNCLHFGFSILLDSVSMAFMGTIFVISGSVMVYCKWYMSDEVYYKRFMGLVKLFVLSMIFMILIPNLVMLLLGWDGLGLTSFLLVAYYQNSKSLSAAMLTALTNRIGDVLVLFSIAMLLNESGWLIYELHSIFSWSILSLTLVMAGMTKSAQMPFCAWLPAAMAAPTPVSSLVHSSTLVTAGVYLVLRSYNVISQSLMSLDVLKMLSLFTLVLAGSSAVFAFDLKKVIALSTLSQLSLMMFAISIKAPFVAFFHLVTHAVFKALLFLGAGGVIHSSKGIQDIRGLAKLWQSLPMSMGAMVVAIVSLSGSPFMSGFYSKDLIIELSMSSNSLTYGVYMIEVAGLLFTSFYSIRIVFNSMLGMFFSNTSVLCSRESGEMRLAFLSLYVGAVFLGGVLGSKSERFSFSVFMDALEMLSVFLIPFVGIFLWVILLKMLCMKMNLKKYVRSYFLSMWFVESLTSHPMKTGFFDVSKQMYRSLDQGWLEFFGPQGVYEGLKSISRVNEKVQGRYFMYHSVFWGSLVGLLVIVIIVK